VARSPNDRGHEFSAGPGGAGRHSPPYDEAVSSAAAAVVRRRTALSQLLVSFRGAASNAVRVKLTLVTSVADEPELQVSLSDERLSHTLAQEEEHVVRSSSASFSRCPADVGPARIARHRTSRFGVLLCSLGDAHLAQAWATPCGL
jgi:hypothetical protein